MNKLYRILVRLTMTLLHLVVYPVCLCVCPEGRPGPSVSVYTRHSQSQRVPHCPPDHRDLWQGYSLLHTEDDGRAHIQDLGQFFNAEKELPDVYPLTLFEVYNVTFCITEIRRAVTLTL